MSHDLAGTPEYQFTMQRLEALKHVSEDGSEYWLAREIHTVLGYPVWDKFEPVLERARDALRGNGIEPSHHIAQTSKMMGLGRGAQREVVDHFLSRPACSLIALNGDPSKPEIAAAQAYFVVQARRMEIEDALRADEKRLELRDKVAQAHKRVSGAAQDAGVNSKMQGVFHDARYQGLYGMSLRQVKQRKGIGEKEQLYDHAGPLELSANDFQMNLAAEALRNENIRGEQQAIRKNKQVAVEVRRVMIQQGAVPPESLPLAPEPISEVRKRVRAQQKVEKKK